MGEDVKIITDITLIAAHFRQSHTLSINIVSRRRRFCFSK